MIADISKPPFWELRRGHGPITDWINTIGYLERRKQIRELEEEIEILEFAYINIKTTNGKHSGMSIDVAKSRLNEAKERLVLLKMN